MYILLHWSSEMRWLIVTIVSALPRSIIFMHIMWYVFSELDNPTALPLAVEPSPSLIIPQNLSLDCRNELS